MGKDKLRRFAELETLDRVIQPSGLYLDRDAAIKGHWHDTMFHNAHPIVLELGCGRGEYTVEMARMFPDKNFIGVDKKGARLWRGVKTINEEQILNAAFLRIQIQQLSAFFASGEIAEIWITFPDPQPQKTRVNLRLTAPRFLRMYRQMLIPGGSVHLKTDNRELYDFSLDTARDCGAIIHTATPDLYGHPEGDAVRSIRTTYEARFLEEGMPICYLNFEFN